MAFTNILFKEKNAIAFVAVNRSKVPNALKMTTMEELGAAFLVFLAFGLISCPNSLHAQATAVYAHDHMPTRCVDVPAGEKRPEFGCFKVGTARGLQFSESKIFWQLWTFPDRATAEQAKSANGVVVEEDGRVWVSEFGPKIIPLRGGERIAVIGPIQLLPAKSYDAEIAYAVMRPGDRSQVHTHPGPEAWYVIAGEQCLETPGGSARARAGGSMFVGPKVPMELDVTGTDVRRALAVVIHEPGQPFGISSDWKPTGACWQ